MKGRHIFSSCVWKFIHPACSLSIFTCAISFLSAGVLPLTLLKLPFLLPISPLPILVPFPSPPVPSLYPFHLTTPMAHPHSISSLTPYNLVPTFPLPQPSVPRKHFFVSNSILLSQHFLQILCTSGGFLTVLHSPDKRNSSTLTCEQFSPIPSIFPTNSFAQHHLMVFYTRFRLKRNEDTHSEAVEKVVSRFFVVQEQFQILKSLKR